MKVQAYTTAFFALLILAGGLIGYFVAGSIPSLVMSSVSAFLLLIASIALLRSLSWGFFLAMALSLLLTAFFTYRFIGNPSPMPALLALISVGVAGTLYWQARRSS